MSERFPASAVGVFLLSFVLLIPSGAGAEGGGGPANPPPKAPAPFQIGDTVKGVSIDLVEGGTWTAEGARGRISVLLFEGTGKDQVAAFRKLNELTKGKGRAGKVSVLGIFEGSTKDGARDILKPEKEKVETPLGIDPEGTVLARFPTTKLPRLVVIDKSGKFALSAGGSHDPKSVGGGIDNILKADAALLQRIETLTEKEMHVGDETYMSTIEGGLDVLPPLFKNMAQSKSPGARDYLQLCVKQVLRRDYLDRHPEIKYVAWMEVDHSTQLLAWWSGLDKKALAAGEYTLPPELEAIVAEGR